MKGHSFQKVPEPTPRIPNYLQIYMKPLEPTLSAPQGSSLLLRLPLLAFCREHRTLLPSLYRRLVHCHARRYPRPQTLSLVWLVLR